MMNTRNIVIQTAGLIESFQNWIKVAAALISAGTEMDIVYPEQCQQQVTQSQQRRS
jgi:hypothetical protein